MGRQKPKREYRRKFTIRCAWCGEAREVVKSSALTCGAVCRNKVKRYRDATGLELEEPAGRRSVKDAVAMLIHFLLIAEQRRRMANARLVDLEGERLAREAAREARKVDEVARSRVAPDDRARAAATGAPVVTSRPRPPRS